MKKTLLSLAYFCLLSFSNAQSGKLDPSFGTGGIVRTNMGSTISNVNSSSQQVIPAPDGSIYILLEGSVTKRMPDGSRDLNYGIRGYTSPLAMANARFGLQPDGKILVTGQLPGSIAYVIIRYNINGTVDTDFGINGTRITPIAIYSVTVQNDGKILVGGVADIASGVSDFALVRYNTDGSVDATFNGNGLALTDFGYIVNGDRGQSIVIHQSTGASVAVQQDGKIILGGYAFAGDYFDFAIARYNTDGSPDTTFDHDGRQSIHLDNARGFSVGIQGDGKIILAGPNGSVWAIVRLTTNGSLDNSFNGNGIVLTSTNFDEEEIGKPLAVQADDKFIITGFFQNGIGYDFIVTRYNNDGTLDNSFGSAGIVTTDIKTSDDFAYSAAVQGDGKILVTGLSFTIPPYRGNFAVTRYNTDGTLDNSFDQDGKLAGDNISGFTKFNATAIQVDGKVVAAGQTWNGTDYDFALIRYNINGSPDSTFGQYGKQITDFGASDEALALAIQPDGKIVLAGRTGIQNSRAAVARYNTDGSLDNMFGENGKLMNAIGSESLFTGIALQADNKIVLSGYNSQAQIASQFLIVRLKSNGAPDSTFNEDGIQSNDFDGSISSHAYSVAIQKDGKIIVAGNSIVNTNAVYQFNFALARYNSDGSPDISFSQDGMQRDIFGDFDYFGTSLALQSDGKIVLAGYADKSGIIDSFVIARYKVNGDLDSTFSDDGFQSSYPGIANAVAINNEGKIAIGGSGFNILLYKRDGSLDSSFSDDGIQATQLGAGTSAIQNLTFSNNKLYAAGFNQVQETTGIVTRYLLCGCHPSAVNMGDITALLQNKTTLLKWQTVSEHDLAGFDIERSIDNNSFLLIGYVAATGNSNAKSDYSTTDPNPVAGVNYYRLKMLDKAGKFTYSKIVSVTLAEETFSFKVFPNPVENVLFITANGKNENAAFRVIDAGGRKLKEVSVSLNGNISLSINVTALPRGIYNLQMRTKTKTEIRKFVKK